MSSSSSSDSDNEQRKLFLAAADPELFSDSMFSNNDIMKKDNENSNNEKKQTLIEPYTKLPKSERYLQDEETFNTDLKISSSMQKFAAKKLSEKIHNLVEFVEEKPLCTSGKLKPKKHKNRIRLLSDSDIVVTSSYEDKFFETIKTNTKRPEIKRREIEPNNIPDDTKLEMCCISPENIINETKNWAPKRNATVFEYKAKMHGTLHYVEPETEFTKMRKKNCWSYKRIARNTK